MRAETLCKRVTNFGYKLLEAEFALDVKAHTVNSISRTEKSLIWVRNPSDKLIIANPPRVGDYLSLLERKEYSYLMHDGGIVQIAFTCQNHEIIQHRLIYHPCPFQIERDELGKFEGGLLDFIVEVLMSDLDENLLLRSPVRFDYSPDSAAEFHPASHVTINDGSCRIPARSPLQFDTFIKFVLENFYLEAWLHTTVKSALVFRQEEECLSAHDRMRVYLNWEHP